MPQPTLAGAAIVFAFALLALSNLRAHEFWVQPDDFNPKPGDRVSLAVRVGDGLPGEPFPRNPAHLTRFEWLEPGSERSAVPGEKGDHPAGKVRTRRPGIHLAVYRSRGTTIELPAETFNAYLEEVGLDEVLGQRARSGHLEADGRETYSRCAKALVSVGGDTERFGHDRVAGLPLELVPLTDPFATVPGQPFELQALYRGEPLAGLRIRAFRPGRDTPVVARTDSRGRAVLRFDHGGFWLLSAVHMTASSSPEADWESIWSSLTFRLPT